jgi:hypothetical protein
LSWEKPPHVETSTVAQIGVYIWERFDKSTSL